MSICCDRDAVFFNMWNKIECDFHKFCLRKHHWRASACQLISVSRRRSMVGRSPLMGRDATDFFPCHRQRLGNPFPFAFGPLTGPWMGRYSLPNRIRTACTGSAQGRITASIGNRKRNQGGGKSPSIPLAYPFGRSYKPRKRKINGNY